MRLLLLFYLAFLAASASASGLGGESLGLYRISLDKENQQHLRIPVREKLQGNTLISMISHFVGIRFSFRAAGGRLEVRCRLCRLFRIRGGGGGDLQGVPRRQIRDGGGGPGGDHQVNQIQ